MVEQMQKMENLKVEMNEIGNNNNGMMQSMDNALRQLNSLEEEFNRLRQDCSKIQGMSKELNGNITRIETSYLRKTTYEAV